MPPIEDESLPTEPIEIELSDDMPGETTVTQETAPKPDRTTVPDDDNPLSKALDAQRRAEELQRTAQRERDEAIRQMRQRGEELTRERSRSEDAEFNSVLTAIAAEQSSLDKAEADYVSALATGDFATAAKVQRIMAQAAGRLDRLEENRQVFEQRRASPQPVERREPAPQPQVQDFEQRIAALPDLAKNWLRRHPEFMNDVGLNRKIQAAHASIIELDGVEPFSPAYFDALDNRFGFKAPLRQEQQATQPQRRSMPMSAPVTRDIPGSNGQRESSTRTTLSPEERDIARKSIVDRPDMPKLTNAQKEYIYAQNKMKLKNQRASGEYRHTTEQTG